MKKLRKERDAEWDEWRSTEMRANADFEAGNLKLREIEAAFHDSEVDKADEKRFRDAGLGRDFEPPIKRHGDAEYGTVEKEMSDPAGGTRGSKLTRNQ